MKEHSQYDRMMRSFIVLLAARHQLDLVYNRLIGLSAERAGYPANLALIDAATAEGRFRGRKVPFSYFYVVCFRAQK